METQTIRLKSELPNEIIKHIVEYIDKDDIEALLNIMKAFKLPNNINLLNMDKVAKLRDKFKQHDLYAESYLMGAFVRAKTITDLIKYNIKNEYEAKINKTLRELEADLHTGFNISVVLAMCYCIDVKLFKIPAKYVALEVGTVIGTAFLYVFAQKKHWV